MSPNYLRTEEMARAMGLEAKTLANWRGNGRGPPYYRAGRNVLYDREETLQWLKATRQAAASEADHG
jgi:hypothetical protein